MTQAWPFQVVFAEMQERFDAFAASDAALAKSGTVTLELALAGCPWWSPTRSAPPTAFLVRRMGVSVDHASLVNLLAGRLVVPEYIQEECTAAKLTEAAAEIPSARKTCAKVQLQGFGEVAKALGDPEPPPSERAAKVVLDVINGRGETRLRWRPIGSEARGLNPAQMICDALIDHARNPQSLGTGAAIDQRLGTVDNAIEERVDLVGQTVLLRNFMRLGGDGGKPIGHGIAAQSVAKDFPLARLQSR